MFYVNPMRVGFGAVLARLSGAKASLLLMFRCFLHRNVPEVMVNMQKNPYILPVKRYGNERNPKLVILLCNPGDDPIKYERLPDYTMYLKGEYKDAGLSLDIACKYNGWWDDFFNVFSRRSICGL